MKKSEEILRMERDMNENPGLMEKLKAEVRRIAEAGEAECDGEALLKAAAALGYAVTTEDLDRAAAEMESVDDRELENVAGGQRAFEKDLCTKDYECYAQWNTVDEDEKGRNAWCLTAWHCSVATLHTETDSKSVACLKNYACDLIYHEKEINK